MNKLLYKIIERMLLGDALSRNKNFAAFEEPRLRRATRIVRHIRSIQRDLRKYGQNGRVSLSEVEASDEVILEESSDFPQPRRRLLLVIEHLKSRRTSYLSEEELRLLRLDPEIDAMLERVEAPVAASEAS